MKVTDRRHHAAAEVVLYAPNGQQVRSNANAGRTATYYGSLTQGGLVNNASGLGTSLDKSEASFFTPTRLYWRSPLEVLYCQSWACRNAIDIPVFDMFQKWRTCEDGDIEGSADQFKEEEDRVRLRERLPKAVAGGSLTGTGMLVLQTKEAPPEEPLEVERIRPGDLMAVQYFDRYDASIRDYDRDLMSPTYNEPDVYYFHPSRGGTMMVHRSRILRFDGITPTTMSGWEVYDQDWGTSEMVPVILSIMQDQVLASGISHLSQEASIPVLKVENLREVLAGRGETEDTDAYDIGKQVNELKSIYRLLMLDKGMEDFERVAVNFGGLADLMDRFSGRVAAARQIPKTRFLASSPAGMNATGESDLRNYYQMIESAREMKLAAAQIQKLDMVIARSAGLKEPPDYEWPSMLEQSDLEKAEADNMKIKNLQMTLADGAIDEDEYRERLDGTWTFGPLPGPAPEPDPELMMPPAPPFGGPPQPPEPPNG